MKVINIHNLKTLVNATESSYYLLVDEIDSEKELDIKVMHSPKYTDFQIIFSYVEGYKDGETVYSEDIIFVSDDTEQHKVVKDVLDMLEIIDKKEFRTDYDWDEIDDKYETRRDGL